MEYVSSLTIPFLSPPNARWPQCILDLNKDLGCHFGHLVRARNAERCDVYIEDEQKKDTPLFLCECKYWHQTVDIRTIRGIITGLTAVQKGWKFVLVFCPKSADFRVWEERKIGCVKIDSQNGYVQWKHEPTGTDREKLMIIVETGPIPIAN